MIINNITEEKINRALQLIKDNGGTVTATGFSVKGIEGMYSRRGNDLIVEITLKPWYIPGSVIENKVKEFFG